MSSKKSLTRHFKMYTTGVLKNLGYCAVGLPCQVFLFRGTM